MIIIKKTREVGKSSGVLLPRDWLNKNVMVQLVTTSLETITKEAIEILIKKNILNEVIGIFLAGSYARGEESPYSDIDLIVVTSKTNKIFKENNYEIICITEENIKKALRKDLYILSLINEAKPLLNEKTLVYYKSLINLQNFNLSILNEIKRILKMNELLLKNEKTINNGIVYSLILRFRELYILNCVFNNRIPSKKEFLDLVGNDKLYKMYEDIKNNLDTKARADANEATKVLEKAKELIKKWEKIKI